MHGAVPADEHLIWPTMSGAGVYWRWESRVGSDGCPSEDCDGADVRYDRGVRTMETWRADTVVILLDGGAVAAWLRNNVRGEEECQGGRKCDPASGAPPQ